MTVIVYHHHDNSSMGRGEGVGIFECDRIRWDEEIKSMLIFFPSGFITVPNVYDWILNDNSSTIMNYANYLHGLKEYKANLQSNGY